MDYQWTHGEDATAADDTLDRYHAAFQLLNFIIGQYSHFVSSR